jgi:ubiquitin C-terminal hydrolase
LLAQELELACERCQHDKVRATFHIRKLPSVLVIHLKRYDREHGRSGTKIHVSLAVCRFKIDGTTNLKLMTKVKAPPGIDLSCFCDGFTENPIDESDQKDWKPVRAATCSCPAYSSFE